MPVVLACTGLPSCVVPSKKVKVPVSGGPEAAGVVAVTMLAVKVTESPKMDGFSLLMSVIETTSGITVRVCEGEALFANAVSPL